MLKKLIALFTLLLILSGMVHTSAQSDPHWEVSLIYYKFDNPNPGIAVTSPGGLIKDIPLSNHIIPDQEGYVFKLSPDFRYLVHTPAVGYASDGAFPELYDLQAEFGFNMLPVPPTFGAFSVGSISPDGTQIALWYYDDGDHTSHLVVVDLASGDTVRDFPSGGFVVLSEWDDQGIHAHESCYNCEPFVDETTIFFNPETGESTATDILGEVSFFNTVSPDRLEATGEVVQLAFDPEYPSYHDTYNPNVIEYYPDGTRASRQVIYSYPLDYVGPSLRDVHWVMDGQALFIQRNGGGDDPTWLLFRDGTLQIFDRVGGAYAAATPEGWIVPAHTVNVELLHVTLQDGKVTSTPLEVPEAVEFSIISQPRLGESITETTFTPYQP